MPYPYDPADLAAIDRLANFYNGGDYDASTNPGGMGRGGHRVNFENALADAARVGAANSAAAAAAGTSATSAGDSATAAALSAAKLIGTSTSSVAIGMGNKGFATQASKFFAVGTFLLIYSAANPTANYMAGQVTSYLGTDLSVDVKVTEGSGTFTDWVIAVAGAPGATGLTGLTGPVGPTPDIMVTFSDGVTDSDPGNGLLKFNNAAPASTTQFFIDNLDRYGTSIATWLDSFDDSTNTALRGTVKLVQVSDPTKYARFNVVGAVVDGTGYRKIPVAHVLSRGTFTNGAILAIDFVRTGNAGLNGDGAGDVLGPAVSVDNRVALFDGTTGKLLKQGPQLADVASSGDAADVDVTTPSGMTATTAQTAIAELHVKKQAVGSGYDDNLLDNAEFRNSLRNLFFPVTGVGGVTEGSIFIDRWRISSNSTNGANASAYESALGFRRATGLPAGVCGAFQHIETRRWRPGYDCGQRILVLQLEVLAVSGPAGDLTAAIITSDTEGGFANSVVRATIDVDPADAAGGWHTITIVATLPNGLTQQALWVDLRSSAVTFDNYWIIRRPVLRWVDSLADAQAISWRARPPGLDELMCRRMYQRVAMTDWRGVAVNSTEILFAHALPVTMRASPTLSLLRSSISGASFELLVGAGFPTAATLGLNGAYAVPNAMAGKLTGFSGLTAGEPAIGNIPDALFELSAEI